MEVLKNDKYNTLYNREGKVSLLYNLTPCSKCQPLQVMQPLRGYDDLYTHAYHKYSLTPGWVRVIWIHVMFEIKIKFTV